MLLGLRAHHPSFKPVNPDSLSYSEISDNCSVRHLWKAFTGLAASPNVLFVTAAPFTKNSPLRTETSSPEIFKVPFGGVKDLSVLER
jgi:hypothetical protein